ncbi:unnamed protein product [Ilex paraguariensis]|uniref:XS domain-containing protein n=1 Tax=Ilex paraguariensis TaxID=185542 RepID=A0ABC8TJT0_9AQUA
MMFSGKMLCSSEEEIAISESEFENYLNDLLKHTSGVGKDTQSRGLREKGIDFGPRGSSAQYTVETIESLKGSDVNELFVWPWMGIVAKIHAEWKDGQYVWEGSSRLSEDLTQRGFNPVWVHPLLNQKGHSGYAMVEFNGDCSGFSNALMFEKSYEANHKGKRDYYTAENIGDDLYGWVAVMTLIQMEL